MGFSLPLKDGPAYANLLEYRKGDTVTIILDITEEILEACRPMTQLQGIVFSIMDRATAHLPFTVIKRKHCWGVRDERASSHFYEVSHDLTLEAANGYVEDLFLWLMNSEVPRWARGGILDTHK